MSVPQLFARQDSPTDFVCDVLVFGVSSTPEGPVVQLAGTGLDAASAGLAPDALTALGMTGGVDQLVRMPLAGVAATSIALVGVGSGTPTVHTLRYAAGTVARRITGVASLGIALPVTSTDELRAVLEGAAIGAYSYTEFRSASLEGTALSATEISAVGVADGVDAASAVRSVNVTATAIARVRDLVNMPPSHLYPETFAALALEFAADLPVEATVLEGDELVAGGFGGIVGVGAGSTRGPRLVKLVYSPADASKHLAFVGKGITFDSGGLSLKPAGSMVGMKNDMAGAATVMAVLIAAAELALPVKLTAWLCIAENMPSGSAIRPNDVLKMYGGTTVEVLNTDAEGRLVLGDGLAAASEEYPDAIIDVATLTGAVRVALGDRYTAVMGDDELVGRLVSVGTETGELFWPMPLPAELRAAISSDVADLANARMGNTAGGMLLAGVFLREFVGNRRSVDGAAADDTAAEGSAAEGTANEGAPAEVGRIPWAHLDIAATAQNPAAPYGYTRKGPTGVAVRTLLELAERFSDE